MTQPKREKVIANNKDTRWDRIRKRHCSNFSANLKSDAVKKFIETDFIGRHQQSILNGKTNLEKSLDPVMVMNLRHEMFKKIPRKLPLATVAYSKNLQQCKDHNVAVEDHYIENQLNQFRKHLQKQHMQNKGPSTKIHPPLIDNTIIIDSLECTHKHIEDFYNAPIDALHQVHDLFAEKQEKHIKLIEDENLKREIIGFEHEHLQNLLDNRVRHEKALDVVSIQEVRKLQRKSEENTFNYLSERLYELNLSKEMVDLKFHVDENEQRTPSPLENTDDILKPLTQVIKDPEAAHLKFVSFDDENNVCHIKREASICSNTSDGIDSVISDLAEEALKELQMEEKVKLFETPDKSKSRKKECNNCTPNECTSHELCEENHTKLMVTGKFAPYVQPTSQEHAEISLIVKPLQKTEEYDSGFNSEKSKIIKDLFQSRGDNKASIMRKYFLKWVHYTTTEKIEREHIDMRADRVKKINIFLNKIRIEKKRLKSCQNTDTNSELTQDYKKIEHKKDTLENIKVNKKYQKKIKVQQDIIDLQRLKLERQERIIMELKLHKLSEESKEARQELKNELKSVIRSGDPKSKAKAKCLQIIGNLKDEEDVNLSKLQGKSLLVPKFLQNMQERALERDIRHEQAKQRRLQQEAEKEAQKLALEEAKRFEDEEAKRLRIEALKEKRRQEKMAKIIKERERQKYIENQRKAQDFYRRALLKRIGMEGFKRLLQRKRDNTRKCENLRQSLYKKSFFQAWFSIYRIHKARRNQKADELYEKCLKRTYFHVWLQYMYEERSKFNVAVDYSEFKLTEIMYHKWRAYVKRMQIIEETKMRQATSHHEWHLKWKVLDCWQRLSQILQLEKETDERRQRWRLKIWELLPDYTPNRDDFNSV